LGHTITDLSLTKADWYTGIFAQTSNATLRDLKVNNASILGRHRAGTLIGGASGTTTLLNLLVTNSTVGLQADGHYWTGGLVGYVDGGTINNA
jgi:hypothetical protein